MLKATLQKKSTERPKKKALKLLRGMRDILPEEQGYWNFIRDRVRSLAEAYGFGRIDIPLLEETALFTRSVGKNTDIIEKEMYSFEDKSGDSISLVPEGTAGIVRSYIEHGMLNRPQPVKMYYISPFFRYDRPQAGRYRQFYQFGFEAIGDQHPVLDAQIMMLAYNFFAELGLPVTLQVNSIGTPECREEYKKVLQDYYKPRKNSLSEDDRNRLQKNPLRLLDSKDPDAQILAQDAPQIIDYLDEESNQHFVQVLEHLDELEIPYVLNPRLVRGLDYYSGTVFEIWPEERKEIPIVEKEVNEKKDESGGSKKSNESQEEEIPQESFVRTPVKPGAQSALGGGGRYDYLVEMLGGHPTPAIGFAAGIERLIIELKNNDCKIPERQAPDIFVAQLGDTARKKSLKLFEDLRQSGFNVSENFAKDGLKVQMELANKLKAKFSVILGQKEIMDGTILIRDMENGIQETVDYSKVIPEIEKRLEKHGVVKKRDEENKET